MGAISTDAWLVFISVLDSHLPDTGTEKASSPAICSHEGGSRLLHRDQRHGPQHRCLRHERCTVRLLDAPIVSDVVNADSSSLIEPRLTDDNLSKRTPIAWSDTSGSTTCNECVKDPGICCAVECQGDGHCPAVALERGGW